MVGSRVRFHDEPTRSVQEYTGGRGVDVALEALGKAVTFGQALSAVRDGGRAVMVGIAPTGTMAEVEITRIVRKEVGRSASDILLENVFLENSRMYFLEV